MTDTDFTPTTRQEELDCAALQVADFQVQSLLGRGGGGRVYLVEYQGVTRAVKVVVTTTPSVTRRLRREVRWLRTFQHPHTVGFVEVRNVADRSLLVQEYLQGGTLRHRIADPWQQADIAAVLLGLAQAIAPMHQAGLLYNDLKPRNVGVQRSGQIRAQQVFQAKLLDFGHVKSRSRCASRGFCTGTPSYAPPEMVLGGQIDATSDVWGLALLGHSLASSSLPPERESYNQVLRWGPYQPLPLAAVARVQLAPAFAHFLDRALSPDPEQRPRDASEFGAVLRELPGAPTAGHPTERGWVWRI